MCLASLHAPLVECVSAQTFGSAIVSLNTQGSRIIVGDMQESVHFTVYKQPENRLLIFADDLQPRWTTATVMVDYTTIAVGDKFGNIFVNRLDLKVSDQVDEDPTGAGILHEKSILMGSPHGTMLLARYHVGDIVTGLHKVSLVAGGREVMLFTCLHGTIGILMPFVSKEDVQFIPTLEQSLVGQDLPRTLAFMRELLSVLKTFRRSLSNSQRALTQHPTWSTRPSRLRLNCRRMHQRPSAHDLAVRRDGLSGSVGFALRLLHRSTRHQTLFRAAYSLKH